MISTIEERQIERLETEIERLRALIQRVVDEAIRKRVDWTTASNWLATCHNGDMYAIRYDIDAELMSSIKSALNPQEEQDDD